MLHLQPLEIEHIRHSAQRLMSCFVLGLSLFFLPATLQAQDTVRLFFESGKYRLDEDHQAQINELLSSYPFDYVDSIAIIGFADSIGKMKANLKLSERRAEAVQERLAATIWAGIPQRTDAKGEGVLGGKKPEFSRRVDVIVYFDQASLSDTLAGTAVDKRCFELAYRVMNKACTSTVSRKGKVTTYLYMELGTPGFSKHDRIYYRLKTAPPDAPLKPVYWKKRRTGELWWERDRWYAKLSLDNTDDADFVVLRSEPCSVCSDTNLQQALQRDQHVYFDVDFFLQQNVQIKPSLFRLTRFKLRVPRAYVDSTDQYFWSPSSDEMVRRLRATPVPDNEPDEDHFIQEMGLHPIRWARLGGLQQNKYYYTYLKRSEIQLGMPISIYRRRPYCAFDHVESEPECASCGLTVYCATLASPARPPVFAVEVGYQYRMSPNAHLPFSGVSVSKYWRTMQAGVLVGATLPLGAVAKIHAGANLLQFSARHFSAAATRWSTSPDPRLIENYFRVYAGSQCSFVANRRDGLAIIPDVHAGLQWLNMRRAVPQLQRIYAQIGAGTELIRSPIPVPFLTAQMGVVVSVSK